MKLRFKMIPVLIALFCMFSVSVLAQDVTVYIDPATKTTGVSETCTVSVAIENVTNLSGFQFDIVFDPAVVQAEDASVGEFLGSTGRNVFPVGPDIDNVGGKITYGAITFGSQAGVDGSGVLAEVVFTGLADGTTDLDIQNLGISDTDGQSIPVQTITDGQITVGGVGGVEVTFRVTVPENTPPGDVVYIAGDFNDWDPGPSSEGATGQGYDVAMTSIGNNQWETSLGFTSGEAILYKYTRGSWATVEKGEAGEEIEDRSLTVPATDFTQEDEVANWADISTGTEVNVTIDPATKTTGVSEPCTVSVAIANVTNLSGFQFDIVFDPAVVQAEDATAGEFLGNTGRTVFPVGPDIDNTTGKITFGAITFGEAAGVDGSGVLADVVFTGLADGTTDLEIQNLGISDINGQPIPVQTITGGQITVRGVGGVEVTFRVTVPDNTPQGDVVYLAGNFNDWDPGPSSQGATGQGYDIAMTSIGNNQWETSLVFTPAEALEYKYTRGSWTTY